MDRDAQLLSDGEREVVIFVAFVKYHRDAVLDGPTSSQQVGILSEVLTPWPLQHAAPGCQS